MHILIIILVQHVHHTINLNIQINSIRLKFLTVFFITMYYCARLYVAISRNSIKSMHYIFIYKDRAYYILSRKK